MHAAAFTPDGFNSRAILPHGLTTAHAQAATNEFVNFLGFINLQLRTREIERLETMLGSRNQSVTLSEGMAGA